MADDVCILLSMYSCTDWFSAFVRIVREEKRVCVEHHDGFVPDLIPHFPIVQINGAAADGDVCAVCDHSRHIGIECIALLPGHSRHSDFFKRNSW